ncbi:hypothetical protein [Poseidonocella sedimentorum]|uniref:Uncharacterized protein n=1 Tax=Poseidonocella sedimentorum TaxID=871652 RepID=A0A1I6EEK1_9RHOB|nr:hypothetical protein [Poseidonocella sedimentorum]SFR16189.1 hypothetical protein SAMN04515673_1117 [Poseidonocella sedimentorum]
MSKSFSVFALIGAVMLGPVLAIAAAPLPDTGPVVVVTPPWKDAESVIEAAGGRVIAPAPAVLAAAGDGDAEFLRKLSGAGAWAVLPAAFFAQLCGITL